MSFDRKGFTLTELLIVVAIIAVLVGISLPVFSSQLEKARQATDLSNIRTAYAEASAEFITGDGSAASVETPVMKHTGLFSKLPEATIGNLDLKTDSTQIASVVKGKTVTVTVDAEGHVTLAASDAGGSESGGSGDGPITLSTVLTDELKKKATNVVYVTYSSLGNPVVISVAGAREVTMKANTLYCCNGTYYLRGSEYYYKWSGAAWVR